MFLLDTCVWSAARRGDRKAVTWLRRADAGALYLSVITLGEIMKGIALRERSDPKGADVLRDWLHRLHRDYADRTLPIDADVALEWGRLAARRPRPMADALMAATALVHRKFVVTRNVQDFADAGVELVNPWA
jgi:predicted nucleic acid-binding protein